MSAPLTLAGPSGEDAAGSSDIQEGMQSHPTELVIGTLSEDQKSKTVINHYQVELLKVIPYPEIPEVNIPADQYAVQLIITSL